MNNMLDKINTRKKSDDFEEYISDVYDKYSSMTIDEDYKDLFEAFVGLIEYIQQMGQNNNDISIAEAIQIMKECGFTDNELKKLIRESMNNGNK